MPDLSTYPHYQAYVSNVKDFLVAEKDIRRTINRALRSNNQLTVQVQTKIYALLYSTFSEANFMKMILTPHGFEQQYLNEIIRQNSIREKWYKCLELAFIRFSSSQKGSEVPNKIQNLKRIVDSHIVDPSLLRNKIAHGQLTVALNRTNTSLNTELTLELQNINVIKVYRWFEVNKRLCSIIEDLIESPNIAHYNNYYTKYQQLEIFINKSETWTIASKMSTPSMSKKLRHASPQ